MDIGDNVGVSCSKLVGTITGIWDKDEIGYDLEGEKKVFARKGQFKVRFKGRPNNCYRTFCINELKKVG